MSWANIDDIEPQSTEITKEAITRAVTDCADALKTHSTSYPYGIVVVDPLAYIDSDNTDKINTELNLSTRQIHQRIKHARPYLERS